MGDKNITVIGESVYSDNKINIFKTIDKETQQTKLQIFISVDDEDTIRNGVLHIKTDEFLVLNLRCIPSECYYVYLSDVLKYTNNAKHVGFEIEYSKRIDTINKTANKDVNIISASIENVLDHIRKIIPHPKEVMDINKWLM